MKFDWVFMLFTLFTLSLGLASLGQQWNQRGSPSALARPRESVKTVKSMKNQSKTMKSQSNGVKTYENQCKSLTYHPNHCISLVFICFHTTALTFHEIRLVFHAFHTFHTFPWLGQPGPTVEPERLPISTGQANGKCEKCEKHEKLSEKHEKSKLSCKTYENQ